MIPVTNQKAIPVMMFQRFRLFLGARIMLVTVMLCSATAYGLDPNRRLTQYVHTVWQTEQGLPQAIDSIGQTKDGYLWLGTYTGLVRFDGVHFTTIEGANRILLENVWIRSVVEDSQGRLWLGTNGAGLIQLQTGGVRQYADTLGLPSNTVYCVVPSRRGDVWACTSDGMARLTGGVTQVYRAAQGLATNTVHAACEAKDGTLWAGGESSRVSAWDGSRFRTRTLRSVPADAIVGAMLCSNDDSLWVGTSKGLAQLKDGRDRLFTVKDGLADDRILCLMEARDGSLWIGTENGFSRLLDGEFESFRSEDGLSQKMVYAIHEDREGSVWVGTLHGLDQFVDGRSIPYTVREGLPSDNVGPVIVDQGGRVWVGTLDHGLAWIDGRHCSVLNGNQGMPTRVHSLAEGSRGSLWVGADTGLTYLLDGRVVQTYTNRAGLPSNVVLSLFRDHSGVLWAGTAGGPAKFESGRFAQPKALRRLSGSFIVAIGEARPGQLYFAAEPRGVYSYENGEVRELLSPEGPLLGADAFYTDQDGLLWIGTNGGGLKLAWNGGVTSFRMRDGLFDDRIYGIVADTLDRLWLASSRGVFSVRRSVLLRFAAGKVRRLSAVPIDLSRTIECEPGAQPAAWRAPDGRLWFSTTRGVVVFDPNRMRKVPPPSSFIEKVMVNGQSKDPARIEKLAPEQKNLEFQYTGLSLLEPGRITFRYILEGFDKEWTQAGTRREAFYTNLPPGGFRFRVTACNADGICNEKGSSVSFELAPYYYQRPWFLSLCVALLILGAWLAHYLHLRRLKGQFGLIVAERNRIARELHDTLIQGFSGLTLQMQALAARLTTPEERGTLGEIIRDAGTYLRETRQSVAGLRSGQGLGLATVIGDSARRLTLEKGVRLKLKLSEDPEHIPAEVQYELLRIAQEAISNSLKHSGARTIEVALSTSGGNIRLSIKDDGSGFVPKEGGGSRRGCYGQIGMKERAARIGARIEIASALGKGTVVRVLAARG